MNTKAQKLEVIANGLNKLAEKGNLIVWLESTRTVVDVDSVCVNGPAIQLKVSESPGAMLGRSKSPAKAAASRENGKRGGRPPYRYAVTVYYDGPYGAKGTVLSKHTTHELAEAAERKYTGGFTGIIAL